MRMLDQEMFINLVAGDRSHCFLPPETSAEDVLRVLHECLLNGEKPVMPLTEGQMNTWIAHTLLTKYSHKYERKVSKARKALINPEEGYV